MCAGTCIAKAATLAFRYEFGCCLFSVGFLHVPASRRRGKDPFAAGDSTPRTPLLEPTVRVESKLPEKRFLASTGVLVALLHVL